MSLINSKDELAVRCIYCAHNKPASDEHYLPECLGRFENFKCLDDRICRDCNNRIGRELEDQFCRAGEIGIMRHRLGIGGKKSHKITVDPFERGSSGASRLEMRGKIPGSDKEVRLRLIKGTKHIEYLTQIIVTTESGEEHEITIPEDMTEPEKFRDELRKRGIGRITLLSLIAPEADSERLSTLVSGIPTKSESGWERLPMTGSTYTWTKYEVTSKYFRAIAKIAFHYVLEHLPFRGDEDMFSEIRRFIMEGGKVDDFVMWSDKLDNQILGVVKEKIVPQFYCHITTAAANPKVVSSRLQFFLGPDSIPPVYKVILAKNDTGVKRSVESGHLFGYYSDGPKDGKDGFMVKLMAL